MRKQHCELQQSLFSGNPDNGLTIQDPEALFGSPSGIMTNIEKSRGPDQLGQIIAALRDPAQRTSRRLVMSAWNPEQLDEMALPPCHVMCQFNVTGGNRLSCALFQRSGDVGLGVPFNIASYSALTIFLAAHCGLVPDKFVYFLGNAHIYADHVAPLSARMADAQLHAFPTMHIREVREKIDDYTIDDFIVEGYEYDPRPLKMAMVA
jgi:thymidylate synthase